MLIALALSVLEQTYADNILRTGIYQVAPTTEFTVTLDVDNTDPFVAFQVDIPIPQGFKYVENSALLNSERIAGHSLSASILNTNVLRLIAYSADNSVFLGNSGSVVSFKLKSGTAPGMFSLLLQQAMIGNDQSANILTSVINGQVRVLAPKLVLSASTLDFGRVPLLGNSYRDFQITNSGSDDLLISELIFNEAQFTTTNSAPITITPGNSINVSVKFAPTIKGNYSKTLQIRSNDAANPVSTVTLQAIGFAVNEIHCGNLTGASSTTGTLELSINNMEELTGFQFDLNLPGPMTYSDGSAILYRTQDHVVAVNQVNNSTLRVVAFSPSNKTFSDISGKIIDLGFLLNGAAGYYGVGISNVIISNAIGENIVSDSYGGQLIITAPDIDAPAQVNFGDVSRLSETTQNIPIYNYGQETLNLQGLLISSEFFKCTTTFPLNVLPYQYFDLPVTFSKKEEGTVSGTLKILSNDPDEYPFTVQLTGKAFSPNYLVLNEQNFYPDESKVVSVDMNNADTVYAIQFDLTFPTGFNPVVNAITLTSRKQDHVIASTSLSSNSIRVLVYSPGMKPITGISGSIVQLPCATVPSMLPGDYNLEFSNVLLSNQTSKNVLYSAQNNILKINPILYGDTDGNKSLSAYDAVLALRYSAGLDPIPAVDPLPWQGWRLKASNVDGSVGGSGEMTISAYDAVLLLRRSAGLINKFPVENTP